MKKLLKKLALLPLFCGLVLTSACSTDEENGNGNGSNDIPTSWFDGTFTATVVNGNAYNDLIDKIGVFISIDTNDNWINEKIATGTWSNGGFTISLPTTLDSRFLWLLGDIYGTTFTFSDRNARITHFFDGTPRIRAFDSDGNLLGFLWNELEGENWWVDMEIVYADRDVTIIGTYTYSCEYEGWTETETWSVSLRRGWNKIYIVDKSTETSWDILFTTEPISGLRWYFEDAGRSLFPATKSTKNTTQSRSIFSRLGR